MNADLEQLLPHRPPMLLISEVVAVQPGTSIVARKAVRADEPWCTATGFPAYLLLESWLQAAAVLAHWAAPSAVDVLVGGLRDVSLGRPAAAGETVEHSVRLIRRVDGAAICAGEARVGEEIVVTVGQAVLGLAQRSGGS